MPTYAYMHGNAVAETVTCDDISLHYHPDYVKACHLLSASDETRVQQNWTVGTDGTFSPPAAPVVVKDSTMSPLAFQARFTPAEMTAIATAAMSNVPLFLFMLTMASAQMIDLHDTRTVAGLDALVAAGLLTAARHAEILTP